MFQHGRTLICGTLFDVEEVAPGWKIADVGVGPAHDPTVVICDGDWAWSRDWKAVLINAAGTEVIILPDEGPGYRTIRPYVSGTWFYIKYEEHENRSRDTFARIYDWHWHLKRSFSVRDVPHDLFVAGNGDTWLTFGEQSLLDENEIAASMLACVDKSGSLVYRHQQHVADKFGFPGPGDPILGILSSYAANLVCDREIWAYYYTDFPLVRIRDYPIDQVWWNIPVRGARAFAVESGRILFTGGYNEINFNLVDLSTLATVQLQPVDQNHEPIEYIGWLSVGQADTLYLVNEQTVHAVTVSEAVEAANG